VELHEFPRRRQRLLLVPELEDGVAADHLLGLDERAIDDAELPVRDAHLRPHGERRQPATIEHAAGLDLPVGELVHRLQEFRRRRHSVGGLDDEHEAHVCELLLRRAAGAIATELSRQSSRRTNPRRIDMRLV
jgi:hypothetical protein